MLLENVCSRTGHVESGVADPADKEVGLPDPIGGQAVEATYTLTLGYAETCRAGTDSTMAHGRLRHPQHRNGVIKHPLTKWPAELLQLLVTASN